MVIFEPMMFLLEKKKKKQKQKKTRRCQLSYKTLGHNFFLYSLFEPALDRLPSASFSKTKKKKKNTTNTHKANIRKKNFHLLKI